VRGAALLLAVVVVACGGGEVDLTGVYRVESAVRSAPCGDDRAVVDPPAYLKFSRGELFGGPFYSYVECADEAATDCVVVGGLLEGFFEPRDHGWVGYSSSATGPDADCQLRVQEQEATLGDDVLLVEEHVHREDHVALPPGRCTPAEAEARGDAMPCVSHARTIATRL
jgi:hypothetical protein